MICTTSGGQYYPVTSTITTQTCTTNATYPVTYYYYPNTNYYGPYTGRSYPVTPTPSVPIYIQECDHDFELVDAEMIRCSKCKKEKKLTVRKEGNRDEGDRIVRFTD